MSIYGRRTSNCRTSNCAGRFDVAPDFLTTVSDPTTPFPTLIFEAPDRWQWPAPPFAWRHLPPPDNDVAQPCSIESQAGSTVQGEMLGFDPVARTITFRTNANGPVVSLPFTRFQRLTLVNPLKPAPQIANAPVERVPAAAQQRDYRLQASPTSEPLTGRTAGRVETPDGMYLFTPVEEEASLQRVFIPRTAYTRCEFGPSAEEVAASRWIASPRELLAAIERQQRMPVLPLGQALLALGLLTQGQLERALARQPATRALGESLVADGVISRADLQTALAHKMGYPLVDLTRFPINPAAVAMLPQRIAIGYRALPLMLDQDRLIVAVEKPSRVAKLRDIHTFAGLTVVPVLASKMHIVVALERLSQDVWAQHVFQRPGFFATTV